MTMLGFFNDPEDGPCALVMLYVGDSFVDNPEHILSASDWYVFSNTTSF
jgi:hypothetical protein